MMIEPYYEDTIIKNLQYPFQCHISESENGKLVINPHWHEHVEFLYYLSGVAEVYAGGESFTAKKGDLVIINAREIHYINAWEGLETRYIVLQFDPSVLHISQTVFEFKYVYPFTTSVSVYSKLFTRDELEETCIPDTIREIYDEFINKNYGFELAVQSGICSVVLWVLRRLKEKGFSVNMKHIMNDPEIKRFEELLKYVEDNYYTDITLDKASRLCNMSYYYFSRQFKKLMGRTFIEYVNYIRIREAERLLTTTDLNITQVALETGFSNSSYFIKQFKSKKGISPKKFRDSIIAEL